MGVGGAGAGTGGKSGAGGSTIGSGGKSGVGGTNAATGGKSGVGGTSPGATGGKSSAGGGSSVSMGGATAGSSGGAAAGGTAASTGGTSASEPELVTSAENNYWKTGTVTTGASGTADVTVNTSSPAQTFDGFGGTFNEMGWNYLSMLSASDKDKAMQLLFGADGCHFRFGRIPIGASDYAMSAYSVDDTAGNAQDLTMANFSLTRDKEKLIPYIQAALAINPDIHLWASPWSPPAWMKDNKNLVGGNMQDNADILTAHALYLSKFVEEYGKLNMTIEAVHPQNEPNYTTNYASCIWTAPLFNKYIRDYLGPTFQERGITAKIYVGTMSNADSGKDGTILSTVTADSKTMGFIGGFGLQWNMIDSVAGLKSKNLPIVQTEHKCGNYRWITDTYNPNTAPNDYAYGIESWGLIRDWIKNGVTSYSAWNMVLDTVGKSLDNWPQNALLNVNTSTKALILTPAYYVFRHASQFVDPGAKVLTTSGGDALAFKNPDGSIVVVMYNSGAAKTAVVAIGSTKLSFSMPGKGFATVNWKP